MVGGMSNVFYLFHIHGIGGACHIVLSSCFNLHKHESGAIGCACYDVYVAMSAAPVAVYDGVALIAKQLGSGFLAPFSKLIMCCHFSPFSFISNKRFFNQAVLSTKPFF